MTQHNQTAPADQPREYVVGFLFAERSGLVALVRKNRPDWQAGRLNGVGGKIETVPDAHGGTRPETPAEAMRREFREEAGLDLEGWEHFATIEEPGNRATYGRGRIFFFRLFVDEDTFGGLRTMTDEPIETHMATATRLAGDLLPNLTWLLPLAGYRNDTYRPLLVQEMPRACWCGAELIPQIHLDGALGCGDDIRHDPLGIAPVESGAIA